MLGRVMKSRAGNLIWSVALLAASSLPLQSQTAPGSAGGDVLRYEPGEQGPDHTVWNKVVTTTDPSGAAVLRTNTAYTELGSGLNRQSPDGSWLRCTEGIAPYAIGAIADGARHRVIFASQLDSWPALDLEAPDGVRIQSTVLCLRYRDLASGKTTILAQLAGVPGRIVGGNRVLYPAGLAGDQTVADVRYTYTIAGTEQDIIVRRAPTPEALGLPSDSTVMEVLSDFASSAEPAIQSGLSTTQAGSVPDDDVDFGAMRFGPGRAFMLGTNSPAVPTAKHWLRVGERRILIESLPVRSVATQLRGLSASHGTNGTTHLANVQPAELPPRPVRPARALNATPMLAATAPSADRGLLLDFTIINVNKSGYVFAADQTYYVSAPFHLAASTKSN